MIKDIHQIDYAFNSRYYAEQEKKEGQYKAHLLFNCEGAMHQVFRSAGNNRSVPKGRTEKELWHRALTVQLRESEQLVYNPITQLLQNMYSWGRMPMQMQVSETFKINKKNGKKCTKAIRLINKLCPLGKVFHKHLWNHCKTRKRHFAYGYTKGRRREQAILTQSQLSWKLRALGINHTKSMKDIANAFPTYY